MNETDYVILGDNRFHKKNAHKFIMMDGMGLVTKIVMTKLVPLILVD